MMEKATGTSGLDNVTAAFGLKVSVATKFDGKPLLRILEMQEKASERAEKLKVMKLVHEAASAGV